MVTLSLVGVRLDARRPGQAYGETPWIQLRDTERVGLLRGGLPADLIPGSVVTSAVLRIATDQAHNGERNLRAQMNAASWAVGRATWRNSPAIVANSVRITSKDSPRARTWWEIDVTDHVQQWVDGVHPNYGWRLSTGQMSPAAFRAFNSGNGNTAYHPQLELEWVAPSEPPDSLNPDGQQAVSVSHPTLTYQVAPQTTAQRVQINDTPDFTTPSFDTGELATTVGELDLSQTDYPGLGDGDGVYWRSQTLGGMGWSAWSELAEFTRADKSALAVTSPGDTTDDSTPPIAWAFDGTQEAWQVIVRDAAGRQVANSGRVGSTDTTWTPPKAVTREGDEVEIEVRVWDDVDRAATPGDPLWVAARRTTTLSASDGVAGPDHAQVVDDALRPVVHLSATRANVPDGWAVVRDGVRIHRLDEPTAEFTYDDWTATPGVEHTYRIAPIVNDLVSSQGPTLTLLPEVDGTWLVDPDTETTAVLWGQDEISWSAEEIAVTHQPLAGPPVRRVAYRPPMAGSVTGSLVDRYDYALGHLLARDSENALWALKAAGADTVLRLITPTRNLPVTVGDVTVWPMPDDHAGQAQMGASFAWWQVDEIPWET